MGRFAHQMPPLLEQFYFSPAHNYFGHHGKPASEHPTFATAELRCEAGRGIIGDRFFDYREDYPGQITFFSAEVFDDLCVSFKIPAASPALLRRNVVTRGIDLTVLIDVEFWIQGVCFRGASECKPCHWMNTAIAMGVESWLRGRGGLCRAACYDPALPGLSAKDAL